MTNQTSPHIISAQHITFRYPDGRLALHDISFDIAPQEKVAIIGANGSGKSTLLLHLNGILRPQNGIIAIDGVPISDKTLQHIRAWVGLVFQNPDDQLFSAYVYDDVAFAPRYLGLSESDVKTRVIHALKMVNMEGYSNRVSHHLSVGEKKRIALATILTTNACILALDEPSAGLDPRARRDLIRLLATFTEQTLLICTHDIRLVADLCTRAIILDEGKLVADGATETIVYDQSLMEQHGLEVP